MTTGSHSEQPASNYLCISSDLAVDVILHRLSGAPYTAIAMLHGIAKFTASRQCKRAIKLGYVTSSQMSHKPQLKKRRMSDAEYAAHWVKAVRAKCVIDENGCWLWTGARGTRGYGERVWRTDNVRIHRQMYKIVHGVRLTSKEVVCHRCDVRHCCNPEHLWAGTRKENMRDCSAKGRADRQWMTACHRGHPFTPENTWIEPKTGWRKCRACKRVQLRIKSGWSPEEAHAMAMLSIPPGQRTKRRTYGKQSHTLGEGAAQ